MSATREEQFALDTLGQVARDAAYEVYGQSDLATQVAALAVPGAWVTGPFSAYRVGARGRMRVQDEHGTRTDVALSRVARGATAPDGVMERMLHAAEMAVGVPVTVRWYWCGTPHGGFSARGMWVEAPTQEDASLATMGAFGPSQCQPERSAWYRARLGREWLGWHAITWRDIVERRTVALRRECFAQLGLERSRAYDRVLADVGGTRDGRVPPEMQLEFSARIDRVEMWHATQDRRVQSMTASDADTALRDGSLFFEAEASS